MRYSKKNQHKIKWIRVIKFIPEFKKRKTQKKNQKFSFRLLVKMVEYVDALLTFSHDHIKIATKL